MKICLGGYLKARLQIKVSCPLSEFDKFDWVR